MPEVDAQAPLAEIVAQERRSHRTTFRIGHRRLRRATQVPGRRLDLHHVRPQTREQLGGKGQRLHLLEAQHPDAIERLAPIEEVGIGDVTQSHRHPVSWSYPRLSIICDVALVAVLVYLAVKA